MSPERKPNSSHDQEPFSFTDHERLYDRVSHERFLSLLNDPQITIFKATVDSNSFGEFLFIGTRRGEGANISNITFYGLGYHEYRERWIDKEWSWYESTPSGDEEAIPKEEALTLIAERQAEIASEVGHQNQTSRGKLYEMLADLTDEDGALSELQDLGGLLDDDDLFS